ncbi:LacI family DNA-binding transcriptional regulator [Rhizobium sp. SSA_523]|uniref:LacI family DNA-binding transcriptional regulator n=1 Tax=Rhizobium sp. SSA_523 TaxID=2952477 RepID=UPI0020917EA0|nr:LacI family DNA-binding transcriptional regulator [Rhizobium sp. SSA_523]MCO5732432.1 LacI family transcriptional regulator [Rhizobium sp. SSA_523]WKC22425.1 LacI family DNA-binding transcriptional regulator [Rhizobium sp. SSA_523]
MSLPRAGSSLHQIASLLGVSSATVSNALAGKGRVSAELVEKIRLTASQLGYVPSQTGRALRTGRTHVLGLVLPNIANPLFPQIAQAIEQCAAKAGYGILIADSHGDIAAQTAAIKRLIERSVDGIIVVPRRGTRIADAGRPVAVIDSPSTPGNTVSADHWQGGQAIVDHLAALGHRQFLLIGNNPDSNVQNDRIGGMRSRLPAGGRAEILWIELHERQRGSGVLLGLREKVAEGFTAFCAVSDLHALRALTELQGAGIAVPQQASVTGFDDLVFSSVITPGLTTVRMDMALIAEIAIRSLTQTIEHETMATQEQPRQARSTLVAAEQKSVPMALVVRQTSGRAAQQKQPMMDLLPEGEHG